MLGVDHATIAAGIATAAVAAWLPEVATEANVAAICGVLLAAVGLATRIVTVVADHCDRRDEMDTLRRENAALRGTLREERRRLLAEFTAAVDDGRPHTDPARRIVEIERVIGPEE